MKHFCKKNQKKISLKIKRNISIWPPVGLKDEITAITFVALGTSLPDTFASKAAAANEKTADNAIGNVTGSNSVNVFMGLGIPWVIATIYWAVVVGCTLLQKNQCCVNLQQHTL